MSTANDDRRVVQFGIDVSIVMPCLNESETLPTCIKSAHSALSTLLDRHGLRGEILIADNGSTDGSQALAKKLKARVVPVAEKGYGAALRGGILAASGKYIVMGDADASYDFEESVAMVEQLRAGYEVCMGTRLKGKIYPGAMPWKNRKIGNPTLTGILNLLFRSQLSDAHSGLRAFTKKAFLRINPTSVGMEFASELVVKAALLGLKRTEVAISLHPDGRSRAPHLRPWRDGWRHLRYLMMLSPTWTFFLPAVILGSVGVAILAALMSVPPGEMFSWGSVQIGDHWAIPAGVAILLAQQAVFAGLGSLALGAREGYRKLNRWTIKVLQRNTFDTFLISGGLLGMLGLLVLGLVIPAWLHFPSDQRFVMMRNMVLGCTLAGAGVQNVFGAMLMAIALGNETDVNRSIRHTHAGLKETSEPFTARVANEQG